MTSRLRLAHQLALLLLVTVLLTMAGLSAVVAWNLRTGFVEYLNARDEERLERFAVVVAQRLAQRPLAEMEASPRALGALLGALDRWERSGAQAPDLDESEAPDEPPRPHRQPPPPHFFRPPPGDAPPGPPLNRPPSNRPPPNHPPPRLNSGPETAAFAARVSVWSLQGQRIMGPAPRAGAPVAERPVMVNDAVAAQVRLELTQRVPDGLDSAFVRRQTLAMAGVAAVLLVLALGLSWLIVRRWVARVEAVRRAASAIAKGQLDTRLPQAGADELADLARSMNAMAHSLQTLEASRRRWMAEMSHELRTPLAVLTGEIEALQDGVRPLKLTAVQSLHDEARQLNRLVDDLHLLALSDLDGLPCDRRPTRLAPLLQAWVERMTPRARERGLALELLPVPEQACVAMDAGRIEQLVINLLENSLRYTDAPGRVEVSLRRVGLRWRLAVDDSAPGVPPELCERLFDPLFRVDAARSRTVTQGGGSGLGLSIAQAIAKAHGAPLRASPSALGGLRVELVFPVDGSGQPASPT